ncbi:MAG: type VI secretion system domain-containing protein, partial [Planctomycetes bacterium]|nr:type VI secretion system domain-containing protein [Planctomycetota bacterium]
FDRLDDLLDKTYPQGAPSVSETKEKLVELRDAFDDLLARKGPGPHQLAAQQVLSQTGCTFVDEAWLAERMRTGVSLPRALNSIAAACADERAGGLTPEQGWAALLDETWRGDASYEQRSTAPAEPEPAPVETPTASAPDSAPTPSAPVTAAPAAPRMTAPIAPAGDAIGALLGACRALRRSDPGQPVAYVALRQLRWQDLLRVEQGATLAGPGDGLRRTLGAMFEAQQWTELLEASEQALENPACAAWLDLQRYACAAMRQIGDPYGDRPREMVIQTLGDMLRRRRWLVEATLSDGAPAADSITRNWLAAEVLGAGGDDAAPEGGGQATHVQAHADDPTTAIIARASEVFDSDGVEAAVAYLQEAEHESRGGRQRAILSQALADLLLRGGHGDLAIPILENLRETMKEAQPPARWEAPDFLARTLEALYHGYASATGLDAGELESRKHAVANELARIDLKRRLRLESR